MVLLNRSARTLYRVLVLIESLTQEWEKASLHFEMEKMGHALEMDGSMRSSVVLPMLIGVSGGLNIHGFGRNVRACMMYHLISNVTDTGALVE